MIIECPKCGFSQPKDKYCANCGVDLETYQQKPAALFSRLMNNSTMHLILIVSLIIGAAFYLVVAQREMISKEVTRIFNGLPILSQKGYEAEEPVATVSTPPSPTAEAEAPASGFVEPSAATKQDPKVAGPPVIEVRYIEVSKENVRALIANGQVVRELSDWRVIFVPNGDSIQGLLNSARKLPGAAKRALPQGGEFEILSGDFDPDPQSPFLSFSMIWTMPNAAVWSLIAQLPNPNPQAQPKFLLSEIQGELAWDPQGALLFIFDPLQRIPLNEGAQLERSPLSVLRSNDFRGGYSDLIIWVELTNKPALF